MARRLGARKVVNTPVTQQETRPSRHGVQTARKVASSPLSRQEQRLSLQTLRDNIINNTTALEQMDQRLALELSMWEDEQRIILESTSDDKRTWTVRLAGAPGTPHAGEQFLLRLRFAEPSHSTKEGCYPSAPPEVTFVGDNVPVNPQIFSNGHLDIPMFSSMWTPNKDAQFVCHVVLGMLSDRENRRPSDDFLYVSMCERDPLTPRTWDHNIRMRNPQAAAGPPPAVLQLAAGPNDISNEPAAKRARLDENIAAMEERVVKAERERDTMEERAVRAEKERDELEKKYRKALLMMGTGGNGEANTGEERRNGAASVE